MAHAAASLGALLTHLIDCAGLYPPAALEMHVVADNYRRCLASPAKMRTTEPTATPLAHFLFEAAARRLPFNATAGLHHPIRAAIHGAERALLLGLLNETDARSFAFTDDLLNWRGPKLTTEHIARARSEFAHSFGSCSFDEPVAGPREPGWIA